MHPSSYSHIQILANVDQQCKMKSLSFPTHRSVHFLIHLKFSSFKKMHMSACVLHLHVVQFKSAQGCKVHNHIHHLRSLSERIYVKISHSKKCIREHTVAPTGTAMQIIARMREASLLSTPHILQCHDLYIFQFFFGSAYK